MGEVLNSLWCSVFLLYAVLASLMPLFRPSLATLPQQYLDFHSQPGFPVGSNPGDVCQRWRCRHRIWCRSILLQSLVFELKQPCSWCSTPPGILSCSITFCPMCLHPLLHIYPAGWNRGNSKFSSTWLKYPAIMHHYNAFLHHLPLVQIRN